MSNAYLAIAVHGFFLNGGARCVITRVASKKNREITLADYRGDVSGKSKTLQGLQALERIDEISLLCAPNEHDVAGLSESLVAHCEKMKDRFCDLECSREGLTAIPSSPCDIFLCRDVLALDQHS